MSQDGRPVTIRATPRYRWGLQIAITVICVINLILQVLNYRAFEHKQPDARLFLVGTWFLGIGVAALVFMSVRALRSRVDVGTDGLVLHDLFRTRRISWPQIDSIGERLRKNRQSAVIRLKSGTEIRVPLWAQDTRARPDRRVAYEIEAARRTLGA
jgi:hypothetical protein